MFETLKRLFQGAPPPVADKIADPVLGVLSWSKEDEAWLSSPEHDGAGFAFQIAGTPAPAELLVCHAADIAKRKDAFIRSVQRFLSDQTTSVRHFSTYGEEIAGLTIERVCLFWPDRPNDSMIFFAGGRDDRLWRCDCVGCTPKGLGFDS